MIILPAKKCQRMNFRLVLSLSECIFIFTPPNEMKDISTSRLGRKLLQILLETGDPSRRNDIKLNISCKVFKEKNEETRQVISPRIRFFTFDSNF